MSSQNPYRDPNGSARNDDNARSRENYTDMPDVDAALNEIVHVGAEIGSGVLGGIAGALGFLYSRSRISGIVRGIRRYVFGRAVHLRKFLKKERKGCCKKKRHG